ncbi:MAG TPA: Arm DNA-binding domain-containing protein [Acidimicrobiales bacterium]|nr:Arm DNA-binding domain-containing protein [Acidimicrobiales bacterium]
MSGRGRNNVRKRGQTWTYYVYVPSGDGGRRQVSKGGFRTRREAEAARVEVLNSLNSGAFVRPDRVTVREFLEDEWLPSQRPPALEESTHRSYTHYVRLHVVPYIGGVPLQNLTPMDLNDLYRRLLDSGRRPPVPPLRQHPPELVRRVTELRAEGRTWQQVADAVAVELPSSRGLTRHAVAALARRQAAPRRSKEQPPAGLKPRTVRYIHSIIHAALKDAMRWGRVARNVADAANPPPVGSVRSGRPHAWTADQLGRFLDFVAEDR